MAASNRELVGRGIDLLKEGLMPFVEREYKRVYDHRWTEELASTLRGNAQAGSSPDSQALLKLMQFRWNEVFDAKLGLAGRSYVNELIDVRNRWAHQEAFSLEDGHRALDTMTRLLQMTAAEQASEVDKLARQLLRQRFDEQARREAKKVAQAPTESMAAGGLKPWREVATPHPDVSSGRYQQAEFAADLAQVVKGEGESEYRDPAEFFRRTYLTEGLKHLLKNAFLRLAGNGGDPVVQLQTSFGGGKTHSMLALYHLFSGQVKLTDLPGLEETLSDVGVSEAIAANRAVFVGTAYTPADPVTKPDGTVVRTMWGKIAYGLGGAEGYAMVAEEDKRSVAPGSDKLKELFDRYAPALILIDEWVAFARNIYGVEGLPSGTFDQNMTFAQALTEGARRSKRTLVIASIPASGTPDAATASIEIGGQGGQAALERLQHTFGRLESVWKPATQDESYEIVRRRLFQTLDADGYNQRDAVVEAYMRLYREGRGEFPNEVREAEYQRRMKVAYPIHPELFDRLYQDWSTLERFQRTRGVLRLMASVIHELWVRNDRTLMIMPATLPLDSSRVRYEMTRYLPEGWTNVIDADIDGENSRSLQLEQERPALGRVSAARRVTRTVYVGSAPAAVTAGARVKGLEEVRVKLGCVQPGESASLFGDALRRLTEKLTYLYTDSSRYWFDTRPSLNRIAADRAADILGSHHALDEEIVRRLRSMRRPDLVTAVHIAPGSSADVADEQSTRLVVLPPSASYARQGSEAERVAREMLAQRGTSPRQHRNALVFLAPDRGQVGALNEAVSQYLAWNAILADKDDLNLPPQDVRQAESRKDDASRTVDSRLQETYVWALIPQQPDPTKPDLNLEGVKVGSGSTGLLERTAAKIKNQGAIVTDWAPMFLLQEIEKYDLWRGEDSIKLEGLWNDFSTYIYLTRLKDENTLLAAVQKGIAEGVLGYAKGKTAAGDWEGVMMGGQPAGIHLGGSYLLKAEVARAWLEGQQAKATPTPGAQTGSSAQPTTNGASAGVASGADTPPAEPRLARRFYGKKAIEPAKLVREAGDISSEIVAHLAKLPGAKVRIVLEVHAEVDGGVPDDIARAIKENANVLKVEHELD